MRFTADGSASFGRPSWAALDDLSIHMDRTVKGEAGTGVQTEKDRKTREKSRFQWLHFVK